VRREARVRARSTREKKPSPANRRGFFYEISVRGGNKGKWKVERASGKWKVEGGKWKVEGGRWLSAGSRVKNRQEAEGSRQ
jgi:hypothetical protein